MNGPQDVGGRHGFGPVVPEDESIRFHAEWEKRVLGVTLASAALGYWNIDASRHARESLPPAIYYGASYYEIWLRGLEALSPAQERFRRRNSPTAGRSRPVSARTAGCRRTRSGGSGQGRPDRTPRPRPPLRHRRPGPHAQSPAEGSHRLPGYARGREGIVTALHGCHVYPDTNAHFEGEQPCPLYTVRFDATELFGGMPIRP
jgi:nitrile hydratase beta subunit